MNEEPALRVDSELPAAVCGRSVRCDAVAVAGTIENDMAVPSPMSY
jgi:hypothetical protein